MRIGRPGKNIMCLNDGKIYQSIADAASYYQVSASAVSLTLNNKRRSVKGLYFIFITGDESPEDLQSIRRDTIAEKCKITFT